MGRRRRKGRAHGPHGIVVANKPTGPTSFAVLKDVQRRVGTGRAGHAGTLDPAASGVLVVLCGEATKLSPWVMGHDKSYLATVALGTETDTLDREGEVVERAPVPELALSRGTVEAAFEGLLGERDQVPPVYSAIKRGGESLMSRARRGEALEPEPRRVVCHGLKLLEVGEDALTIEVDCGSGYYVRAFARDLARALGTVGHLAALVRTRVGPFHLDEALALEDIDASRVQSMARAVPEIPALKVDAETATRLRNGIAIDDAGDTGRALAIDPEGQPVAMLERTADGRLRVLRGFRLAPEA